MSSKLSAQRTVLTIMETGNTERDTTMTAEQQGKGELNRMDGIGMGRAMKLLAIIAIVAAFAMGVSVAAFVSWIFLQ